jgi:hypothetical protein
MLGCVHSTDNAATHLAKDESEKIVVSYQCIRILICTYIALHCTYIALHCTYIALHCTNIAMIYVK